MTSLLIAALSTGFLLSACSSLGPFKEVDTNQDSGVSHEEAAARSEDLASVFNTADDDNDDGVLNEEEYEFVRAFLQKSRTSTHRGPPKTQGGSDGGGHSH